MIKSVISSVCLILFMGSAFARDGWQDRPHACDMASGPRLDKCQYWIQTVQRPDIRGASCCGDADAFLADNFELGLNGELYAIITANYQEPTGYELDDGSIAPAPFSVHFGQKILIPLEKRNSLAEDANRSGHGVVFLKPANGEVLCYFAPPLI